MYRNNGSRRWRTPRGFLVPGTLLGALLWFSPAHAGVQASGATPITPSDSMLELNQVITLQVTISNTSTNTNPPNTDPVPATLTGTTTVKLACTSPSCATELPGTLTFLSCTPAAAGVASCALDPGDPTGNTVLITMTAGGVSVPAMGSAVLADITVQATTPITTPDGMFFTRADTGLNDLVACQVPEPAEGPLCAGGNAGGSAVLMFAAVCGDGIVNQPFETCDTMPLPGVPGPGQCCPAIRADGSPNPCGSPAGSQVDCPANGNLCRDNASPDPCTICGDGVVQMTSGEACDDGNAVDTDSCTNACLTTTTSTSTSSSTSSSSTTSSSSSSSTTSSSTSTSVSTSTTSTSSSTTTSTTIPSNLRHFQCYEVRPPGAFSRTGISLVDAYGSLTVDVTAAATVCAPADKNGEDPTAVDEVWHLTSYQIGVVGPRFERVRGIATTNQFGDLTVNLIKPGRLFVPSLKNGSPAGPDMPDHFTCYDIDRTRGTPAFTPQRGVTISTQFEDAVIDVIEPIRFCVPTDKNGEGIGNPGAHLMCYRTKGTGSFPPLTVTIDNQFGPQSWSIRQRRELCVPTSVISDAVEALNARAPAASLAMPGMGMRR